MIGCVGSGDGAMVMDIDVDVGTGVGETAVRMGVSVGKALVCFPQAARNTNRMIQELPREVVFMQSFFRLIQY